MLTSKEPFWLNTNHIKAKFTVLKSAYGWTDQQTNQRTNQQMDTPSYRDAWMRLKAVRVRYGIFSTVFLFVVACKTTKANIYQIRFDTRQHQSHTLVRVSNGT